MERVRDMSRVNQLDPWDPKRLPEESPYYWKGSPQVLRRSSLRDEGRLILVDLFSGAGGFSVGFEQAGFVSALGLDIYTVAAKTFMEHHPRAGFILGDARAVTPEMLLEALNGLRPHVVTGGVPCQGFSLTNRKRNDEDPRNYLFREFIRLARFLDPDVLIVENVSGIRSAANGKFVLEIVRAMEEAGYRAHVEVLNAADFGVPQHRKRIFFVGVRPGIEFRWPRPTHGPLGEHPWVSVWEAIGDLPPLGPGESAHEYHLPPQTDYQRRMREGAVLLGNHESPKHPKGTSEMIANTPPGEPMYEKFRQRIRLHPDRPSPTIVAGGIRPQFQFGHPTQPRGLTVRELARLQSFPDVVYFHGGIVQGRVQTGNAVPPLMARALALAVRAALEDGFDPEEHGVPLRSAVTRVALF